MPSFRLARVAAQAERLRLQRQAARLARRAALLGVFTFFFGLALLALHVAALIALARHMPAEYAALCVAGADLALALLAVLLARRTMQPDTAEREARALRDQALAPFIGTLAVARPLLRLLVLLGRK